MHRAQWRSCISKKKKLSQLAEVRTRLLALLVRSGTIPGLIFLYQQTKQSNTHISSLLVRTARQQIPGHYDRYDVTAGLVIIFTTFFPNLSSRRRTIYLAPRSIDKCRTIFWWTFGDRAAANDSLALAVPYMPHKFL